jgi:hypothetical protein
MLIQSVGTVAYFILRSLKNSRGSWLHLAANGLGTDALDQWSSTWGRLRHNLNETQEPLEP